MSSYLLIWNQIPKAVRYGICGALLLLTVLLAFLALFSKLEKQEEAAFEHGQAEVRVEAAETVIKNVEIANDVEQELKAEAVIGSGSALYAQCVRSARTPANCQRFLPSGQKTEH